VTLIRPARTGRPSDGAPAYEIDVEIPHGRQRSAEPATA
jgi:hypothetical protein